MIFGVIVAILFFQASSVLLRKTVNGSWNYSVKVGGYQNLPEEYSGCFGLWLQPYVLYVESAGNVAGLSNFFLCIGDAAATYARDLSLCKIYSGDAETKGHSLETYMMSSDGGYPSEAVAHDAVDPLPWSSIKSDLIKSIVPSDERLYYYLPF